jgi:regulatory protein
VRCDDDDGPPVAKPAAYLVALTMLARRELSEKQIRERLARRDYDETTIDEAVARLRAERAVDDERVAGAIARTSTSIKRRGRLRVRREIEQAGISSSIARAAVDATFDDIDEDALFEAALARRLRGRDQVTAPADIARLYRYMIGQGFEHDRIMKRLDRLKRRR